MELWKQGKRLKVMLPPPGADPTEIPKGIWMDLADIDALNENTSMEIGGSLQQTKLTVKHPRSVARFLRKATVSVSLKMDEDGLNKDLMGNPLR
jgi:hypothetical protein